MENELNLRIKCLRSDRGGEFTYSEFNTFCEQHGIKRQFSTLRTHQQNGVVERKNQTIQEATRTMMKESNVLDVYQREAIHTIVYVLNRVQIIGNNTKTPFELWTSKTPIVKYFKVFGSRCYIKRDDENIGKFDARCDEGIFLGYSTTNKTYRCFNKKLRKIVESDNVKVDEDMHRPIEISEVEPDDPISGKVPEDNKGNLEEEEEQIEE